MSPATTRPPHAEFLLKFVGDKVVVKQADKDLSGIDMPTADFAVVGRADPAIRVFFGAGK